MVGAGVLARDEDYVGVLNIGHRHRALADTDRVRQCRAGRFVAHVGTVGQVVGAQAADQQLVAECGLVTGTARGIEHQPIGVVGRPDLVGDERIGVVPVDRAVVGFTRAQHHRVGQAALLAEPVFGCLPKFLDGVFCEERGGDGACGGLLGDGLGSVFAELGEFAVAGGLRPGATGAIKAVTLIQLGQCRGGA